MKNVLLICLTLLLSRAYSQSENTIRIYPNPFCEKATIHLELSQAETVSVRIYDVAGRELAIFYNNKMLAKGIHDTILIGDSLNDGNYYVAAKIGGGSFTSRLVKTCTTSLGDEGQSKKPFSIYPNPATNGIWIPFEGFKTIRVFDVSGREVSSIQTRESYVLLTHLAKGTYLLEVNNEKGEELIRQQFSKLD